MRFDGRFCVNGLYINYDKKLAFDAFADANDEVLSMSSDQWESKFTDWVAVRFESKDGRTIGAAIIKDGEGHIGILKDFRGKWGGSKSIVELCKHFNVNKTCAFSSDVKATSMLANAGFIIVSSHNGVNYYELSR